jgi:uncharacterized repeat protein (TIGR02543 family)
MKRFLTMMLLAMTLAFGMTAIGCEQAADEAQAPRSGLTLKATEAGAYAVRVYPSIEIEEDEAVGFDAWLEATAEEKLAAQGEATAEGAEVLVSLTAVPEDESHGTGAFAQTDSFLVVVKTGEAERYAVASFQDGSAALDLDNMKDAPETPDYRLALSETETVILEGANAGYKAQTAKIITVANIGKENTGSLKIALSGDHADSFTLNKDTITNIAVGNRTTFTVVLKTKMKAGIYIANVTVSGNNEIEAGFEVSFTVNNEDGTPPSVERADTEDGTPPPVGEPDTEYGIALSQTETLYFDAAAFGYDEQPEKNVTITNTGSQPTGELTVALTGAASSAFTLSKQTIDSIAAGGENSFTVVPVTELAARDAPYIATVTVSGANGISAAFSVSFRVYTDSVYDIELSQTEPLVFAGAVEGYKNIAPQAITVRNIGNQPTWVLTIALTGAEPSAFTLSKQAIGDIAAGGENSFTVAPATGLAARDAPYTATVTVRGANDNVAAQSFEVSFVVLEYGISVSAASGEFAKQREDYAAITPMEITITNIGIRATAALTATVVDEASDTEGISGAGAFVLTDTSIWTIPAGGQAVFGAMPRTGLLADEAGITVYTARVVISGGTGNSAVSESVDLKFAVMKKRVVSFNVNGGTPQIVAQTVTHGGLASEPVYSVSKANLRFKRWYADGQTVAFDFATPITADTRINALWEADVTFNLNGGEGKAPSKQIVNEGDKATGPVTPVWTSYRFDGWYTQAAGGAKWDFAKNAVTGHTVLYARWTRLWTVTFNLNGGTSGSIASQTIADGGKATQPGNPAKTRNRFDGWYTQAEGGSKWNFATAITQNLTLYARWTPLWRVTFVLNGGTYYTAMGASGYISRSGNVFTVAHNAVFITPVAYKEGFSTFDGWFSNEALTKRETNLLFPTPDREVTVTSDMTLYAKYK